MKQILRTIGVLFFAMITTGIFAQQGRGMRNTDPKEMADRQVATMKEIIKINAKEEAKINEIFLNAGKEQQKQFQSMANGGDREAMRAKMTELNKKRDAELLKVLGKERMDVYTKEMEKRRSERSQNRSRGNN